MKYLMILILPFLLSADSTFITPMEYASSLYKNPRGIGCDKCHGDYGQGKLVATYMDKGKVKYFRGSRINNVSFKDFYKTLNQRNRGMPRYYLTKGAIKALYLYLHTKDKKYE